MLLGFFILSLSLSTHICLLFRFINVIHVQNQHFPKTMNLPVVIEVQRWKTITQIETIIIMHNFMFSEVTQCEDEGEED